MIVFPRVCFLVYLLHDQFRSFTLHSFHIVFVKVAVTSMICPKKGKGRGGGRLLRKIKPSLSHRCTAKEQRGKDKVPRCSEESSHGKEKKCKGNG